MTRPDHEMDDHEPQECSFFSFNSDQIFTFEFCSGAALEHWQPIVIDITPETGLIVSRNTHVPFINHVGIILGRRQRPPQSKPPGATWNRQTARGGGGRRPSREDSNDQLIVMGMNRFGYEILPLDQFCMGFAHSFVNVPQQSSEPARTEMLQRIATLLKCTWTRPYDLLAHNCFEFVDASVYGFGRPLVFVLLILSVLFILVGFVKN